MTRRVAGWALAAVVASIAPMARGQSAASDVDNADGGIEQTKSQTPGNKDAPSDVRALDPARATPSGENTATSAPTAKQRDESREPPPSDVRALDPTREVPSEENKAAEPGK